MTSAAPIQFQPGEAHAFLVRLQTPLVRTTMRYLHVDFVTSELNVIPRVDEQTASPTALPDLLGLWTNNYYRTAPLSKLMAVPECVLL